MFNVRLLGENVATFKETKTNKKMNKCETT